MSPWPGSPRGARAGEASPERGDRPPIAPLLIRLTGPSSVVGSLRASQVARLIQSVAAGTAVRLVLGAPGPDAVERARRAVLAGEADAAVHLADELPCPAHDRLEVIAIPWRGDPRDVLSARGGLTFQRLPVGARVGAAGASRLLQLAGLRPDLEWVRIDADVASALERVERGSLDAVVVPSAEVALLGLGGRVSHTFSLESLVPAAGRAALVLEARRRDGEVLRALQAVDHPISRLEVAAERAVLRRLQAWPTSSVGVTAEAKYGAMAICGVLAPGPGRPLLRAERSGPAAMVEQIAASVASALLLQEEATQPDSSWPSRP